MLFRQLFDSLSSTYSYLLADEATGEAVIIAVVRDEELVDELPEDPHDIRMGWALTPGKGLVRLGSDDRAEQHTP